MRLPALAAICGLGLAFAASGCAAAVAGQAEVAGAAAGAGSPPSSVRLSSAVSVSRGQAFPSPVPVATSPATTSPADATPGTTTRATTTAATTPSPGRAGTTHAPVATGRPETTTSLEPSTARTSARTGATTSTGIPGLSPECSKVEAAITSFGTVFDGASSAETVISQETAQAALQQMPASGLPARPQGDITILRAVVSSAGGRTLTQLALSLSDGKATGALEDLASWAAQHCS